MDESGINRADRPSGGDESGFSPAHFLAGVAGVSAVAGLGARAQPGALNVLVSRPADRSPRAAVRTGCYMDRWHIWLTRGGRRWRVAEGAPGSRPCPS